MWHLVTQRGLARPKRRKAAVRHGNKEGALGGRRRGAGRWAEAGESAFLFWRWGRGLAGVAYTQAQMDPCVNAGAT